MKISTEEKIMYDVMRAIYESGIPIDFKGSMVLKACLMEAGYPNEIRHTVDIDANWHSDAELTKEAMVNSLQNIMDKNGIDLKVDMYRMYGRGRSAGFEFKDKILDVVLFTMDIDVNRPILETKIYEVAGISFCGVVPNQMIADKLYVISTDKIFRRIKDVIDLFYISKVMVFDYSKISEILDKNGRVLGPFDGFLHKQDDLKHSYDKFKFVGDVDKPTFEEVYSSVIEFIKEALTNN